MIYPSVLISLLSLDLLTSSIFHFVEIIDEKQMVEKVKTQMLSNLLVFFLLSSASAGDYGPIEKVS